MNDLDCEGLTGKVIVPGDPGYERARQDYNRAISQYPAMIVYGTDSRDIASAICRAEKDGLELRVRSGGHDYEGYSNGTGKLVIDTSLLKHVQINLQDATVKVQAGTRLLSLYEQLYEYGYAFPGGTCPTVAISGLILGGGIGLSTRYLGLTADSLLEATMINYAGEQLVASQQCNSDLFWALRGAGGGNFGVVTDYTFRLEKVDQITVIQLRWDNNKAARDRFLPLWQEWLPGLDCRMSAFGGIYPDGAWLNGFFYGTTEVARQRLRPFLAIPGLNLDITMYVPFIDAIKIIGAIYPKSETFQAAGRFVQKTLPKGQLDTLIQLIEQAPSQRDSSIRVYSLGGAVREVKPEETAFAYRQADYIMALMSAWKREDEARAHRRWIMQGFCFIEAITRGSYINFPYNRTQGYLQAYFGKNLPRLQEIKAAYDPYNVFRFPQSLQPPL